MKYYSIVILLSSLVLTGCPEIPPSKFKEGDLVAHVTDPREPIGVVVNRNGISHYTVRGKDKEGEFFTEMFQEFELVQASKLINSNTTTNTRVK